MYYDEIEGSDSADKKEKRNTLVVFSLLLNILLASLGGYLYFQNQELSKDLSQHSLKVNELTQSLIELEQQLNMSLQQLEYYRDLTEYYSSIVSSDSNATGRRGKVDMPILAVQALKTFFNAEYQGHVLHAVLELQEGEGRILVNTEVINGVDIQTSVRTATQVVERLTGISFSNTDIILTITATNQVDAVDGPSAGGAITVALMAALENKQIIEGVYMTGTIQSDGAIGQVSGIPHKALAAAVDGADKILVPEGQGNVVIYEPKTVKIGRLSYTTYEKVFVHLEDYLADEGYTVDVVEISSVIEAYQLFTGQN
ncbi:hypothetical protein GF319_13700 [Candidatus Bathyarchaeota archaeon]|nr:hypothetical protein [Candidatus Bathyarchaeota archaeon]